MRSFRNRFSVQAGKPPESVSACPPGAIEQASPSYSQALFIIVTGAAVVVFAGVTVRIGWEHNIYDVWVFALAESIGVSFVAAGLLAWWIRPANRIGPLMVLGGASWYIGNLQDSSNPVLFALSYWLYYLDTAIFCHLVSVFPHGRLVRAFDRWIVILAYSTYLTLQGIRYFQEGSQGKIGWQAPLPHSILADIISACALVITLLTFWSLLQRWRTAKSAARRPYAPVWGGIMFLGVVAAANIIASILKLAPSLQLGLTLAYGIMLVILPFAFLSGLLRARLAMLEIFDLIPQLQDTPSPALLQDLLARALGDPDLKLRFRAVDSDNYVDIQGQRVILPDSSKGQTITPVQSSGQPIAVLVHDSALDEQQFLIKNIVKVAQQALERARSQVTEVAELQASRTRIAEDALDERRRIERDLHDGVQHRLLLLRHHIEQARHDAATQHHPGLTTQLDVIAADLSATYTVVRDLAQGIHPAILQIRGLAVAVEELADRSNIPVYVDLPRQRWPDVVEATAYFAISEALSNTTKHANANHVTVSGREQKGRLIINITDDGVGGADPAKHGLRGMRDRIHAIRGSLHINSPVGQGTKITLELPCE